MSRSGPTLGYTTREAARLLGVADHVVRGYVYSNLVEPRRGERREYRYSFQDLVVMRTAIELSSRLPTRRVRRALRRLRDGLGPGNSLSKLLLSVEGRELIVRQGEGRTNSFGQMLLEFEAQASAGALTRIGPRPIDRAVEGMDADAWFDLGVRLERDDPLEAGLCYQRALAEDPDHFEALLNLGRLEHESGNVQQAQRLYHRASKAHPLQALPFFNRGVALEDLQRTDAAIEAYRQALALDVRLADAHFNLARLLESKGRNQEALHHLNRYRKLKE